MKERTIKALMPTLVFLSFLSCEKVVEIETIVKITGNLKGKESNYSGLKDATLCADFTYTRIYKNDYLKGLLKMDSLKKKVKRLCTNGQVSRDNVFSGSFKIAELFLEDNPDKKIKISKVNNVDFVVYDEHDAIDSYNIDISSKDMCFDEEDNEILTTLSFEYKYTISSEASDYISCVRELTKIFGTAVMDPDKADELCEEFKSRN